MRKLFICETPLHIFNALNLQFHEDEKNRLNADLYIVNNFSGAEMLYQRMLVDRWFGMIYLIPKYENKFSRNKIIKKIQILNELIMSKIILKKQIPNLMLEVLENKVENTPDIYICRYYDINTIRIRR